jgi:protein tyrosine/serine phosphatase
MRRRTAFRATVLAVVLVIAGVIGFLQYLQFSGNFHEVVAGEVYRSNQVTPDALATYKAEHDIRSVLNLRGAEPGAEWYDDEIAASAALGLTHVDFHMSGNVELSDADAAKLIALMRTMPKPLLVHCLRGSDRTGLAMALYLGAIRRMDMADAGAQLSLRFGHFSVPYLSTTYPMDVSWNRLVGVLGIDRG